jgi:hypothetical protein
VDATGGLTTPIISNIDAFFNTPVTATKNGYIFVFVSN